MHGAHRSEDIMKQSLTIVLTLLSIGCVPAKNDSSCEQIYICLNDTAGESSCECNDGTACNDNDDCLEVCPCE